MTADEAAAMPMGISVEVGDGAQFASVAGFAPESRQQLEQWVATLRVPHRVFTVFASDDGWMALCHLREPALTGADVATARASAAASERRPYRIDGTIRQESMARLSGLANGEEHVRVLWVEDGALVGFVTLGYLLQNDGAFLIELAALPDRIADGPPVAPPAP